MRVFLTGGGGLLGRAVLRQAALHRPDLELSAPSSAELDLRDADAVLDYCRAGRFEAVIHCAARVGGIQMNARDPYGFLSDNIAMNAAVIDAARALGIARLFFIGSANMYPDAISRPISEADLFTAPFNPTSEAYALSKVVGAKLCEFARRQDGLHYSTLIPCNLYGPDDHFGTEKAHLIPAILTKLYQAVRNGEETVEIWGDGQARREFLYSDDLGRFIVTRLDDLGQLPAMLNLGMGEDCSILDYYEMAAEIAGYKGRFTFDLSKPVGMTRKLLDSGLAKSHGWTPQISIKAGLTLAYDACQRSLESKG